MGTEQEADNGIIPRFLATYVSLGCRRPWLVLAATLLSCAICLWGALNFLRYENQRNDLHDKSKDYYKRWQQYVAEFGDDDDMVVVVKGPSRIQIEQGIEDLAAEIRKQPNQFDRLFYKVDLRPLHDRALLFLPADQIRQ